MKRLVFIPVLLVIVFFSCKDNPSGVSGEYAQVNSWIRANMDFYYFWDQFVPDEADGTIPPEVFYEDIQNPTDRFSFIRDDAEALLDDLNGNSVSAGYSPAFVEFPEQMRYLSLSNSYIPEHPLLMKEWNGEI